MKPLQLCMFGTVLLLLVGCLEHKEEIVVNRDGSVQWTVRIEGDRDDVANSVMTPRGARWSIDVDDKPGTGDKAPSRTIRAETDFDSGMTLPATFTSDNSADAELNVMFPTEVRTWNEDGRVFYEFTRVYKARTWRRYNYGNEFIDDDVERTVEEDGVFALEAEQREQYIKDVLKGEAYREITLMGDAMGRFIATGELADWQRDSLSELAQTEFLDTMEPDTFLSILRLKDEDILDSAFTAFREVAIERIRSVIDRQLRKYNVTAADQIWTAIDRQRKAYELTEDLRDEAFQIGVKMPGTIIRTNAPESDNSEALWEFEGQDMADRDIPLYVLSVVVEPKP